MLLTKICAKCKVEKDKRCFYQRKKSNNSLSYRCKACEHVYYQNNIAKFLSRNKAYRQANANKIAARKKVYRRYLHETNPLYRLERDVGRCVRRAIKSGGGKKSGRTFELTGCTPIEFRAYIESKFLPGMTWENRHLWHLDHIRPLASFDLTQPSEQRIAFHYTNYQPLWATDNLKKNSHYAGICHRRPVRTAVLTSVAHLPTTTSVSFVPPAPTYRSLARLIFPR